VVQVPAPASSTAAPKTEPPAAQMLEASKTSGPKE
jgi:hypothetical protein